MKATVKEDIIVRVHNAGLTEIGTLPKDIGFERIRFDGTQVVDLNDLPQIWVVDHGTRFTLHCREIFKTVTVDNEESQVSVAQLVTMTYADRKSLINDDGTIRVKTQAELDAAVAFEAEEIAEQAETKTEFRNSVFAAVTITQAENYIQNNVTDLASAKQVLKIMARMMIAQRNAIKRLAVR
jgi:hypothetical protein